MNEGRTAQECDQIIANLKGRDPEPGQLTGCPMGRGGTFIYGGEGNDTVHIYNNDKEMDAAIARMDAGEELAPPSRPSISVPVGENAPASRNSSDASVELAFIGAFVVVACLIFVLKFLGRE